MARVLHRLVIRDSRGAVLLLTDGERRRLPEVWLEEKHTADVEHINAVVREQWGLETTVLRGIEHDDRGDGVRRAHLLELHGPRRLASGAAWTQARGLAEAALDEDHDRLARLGLGPVGTADGCEWMRPGWWPAVRQWVEVHVGGAEIVQLRAWESSCVARVRPLSEVGEDFYFKALPASGAHELRVTAELSRRSMPGSPQVAAADFERRWLLLRAAPGRCLEESRHAAAWAQAAATYGRLQATTVGRGDEWRALGCAGRGLDDLSAAIDPLLADTAALMPDHPDGLTSDQLGALRERRAALRRRCTALGNAGIASALDHGDFWPSNIFVGAAQCVVIDWEDACVNHPFLSLGPFLAMLRTWAVELDVEGVADAYLPAFSSLRPMPELQRAFSEALPLTMLDMAVRYWRMPAAVVALHPWMREMVPFFLRHLLDLC